MQLIIVLKWDKVFLINAMHITRRCELILSATEKDINS